MSHHATQIRAISELYDPELGARGSSAIAGSMVIAVRLVCSSVGTLPTSWAFQTIWQNPESGGIPGDQSKFNGAFDRVQAFAH
jgi:hypothetical protein